MGWKRTTAIVLVAVFALDVFVGALGTPDQFRPLYIASLIVEWLLIWPMAKLGGAFGALSTYAAIATTFLWFHIKPALLVATERFVTLVFTPFLMLGAFFLRIGEAMTLNGAIPATVMAPAVFAVLLLFGAILTFVWLAQRYVLAPAPVANTSKDMKVD
jgi:hypothetical protein